VKEIIRPDEWDERMATVRPKPDNDRRVKSPLERVELCVHNGDAVGKHPYVVAEDLDQAFKVAAVLGKTLADFIAQG
jgi:hypothetical protein